MTPDQFGAIISNLQETPSLEFKGPGSITDQSLFFKVLKGMIAMSNREDGGTIIVGVTDEKVVGNARRHEATGLSPEQLATWDSDHLADKILKYTDPRILFHSEVHTDGGRQFQVIEVHEFQETPVFAAKEVTQHGGKPSLLKKGGLYIRSAHKPETVLLTTAFEMRSLLSVALSKHMRRHLATSSAAGLRLASGPMESENYSLSENYNQELEQSAPELEEMTKSIKERCYWKIIIRPDQYVKHRVKFTELREIVSQSSVSLRGWNFPHVEYGPDHDFKGTNWLGQGLSWNHIQETWRMFRSAQFEFIGGLYEDWSQPGQFVDSQLGRFPIWGSIYRILETFEFASRLAATGVGSSRMLVQIETGNINYRQLYNDNPKKTGIRKYTGPASFVHPDDPKSYVDRNQLLAEPRSLAAEATSELLQTFEFDVSPEGVMIWQSELGR